MEFNNITHIREAKPIINSIVYIMGGLSALAIVGGLLSIIWNIVSPTQINFLGAHINTGHVGVALTSIGILSMVYVVISILKHLHKLAEIENSKEQE